MSKILLIGSGGREHAITWSLAQEGENELLCVPGNAGTASLAGGLDVDVNDHDDLIRVVKKEKVNLTIVGPEAPLAAGVVDRFKAEGLRIFGPTRAAARLESSKLFARNFMREVGIPHPDYRPCRSKDEAYAAGKELGLPVVLKADGLAAGKGVIICRTQQEVDEALGLFFDQRAFGYAGLALSVEQCLEGSEMSVFALCDGESFVIIGTAQDYKRAYDGDEGPNTGGMGSIAPSPLATPELVAEIAETVLQPTVNGMKARGYPYTGCLYAGLMIVEGRPKVIEFNVRLGDPETQVVLPLLDTPLSELIEQAITGELPLGVAARSEAAICVVVASEGYPGKYEKGKPIGGLEDLDEDIIVFHAGTDESEGQLVSAGGRVLNVVGLGETIPAAAARVYENIPRIDFPGSFYRKDIGG